jgi:hypothetical protein
VSIERVKQGFLAIKDGMKLLDGGPLEYYMSKLTGCYDLLIDRFAPFKVGDTVELIQTPVISETEAWGWMAGKHFLVEGARGVVREVDVDGQGFRALVAFDDDSWIEHNTKIVHAIPPKDRGLYSFKERWLRNCTTNAKQGKA